MPVPRPMPHAFEQMEPGAGDEARDFFAVLRWGLDVFGEGEDVDRHIDAAELHALVPIRMAARTRAGWSMQSCCTKAEPSEVPMKMAGPLQTAALSSAKSRAKLSIGQGMGALQRVAPMPRLSNTKFRNCREKC